MEKSVTKIQHQRNYNFVEESNRIENIHYVSTAEVDEFEKFLELEKPNLGDLICFVKIYQPNARLRISPMDNVQVGDYIPPRGGEKLVQNVQILLEDTYTPGKPGENGKSKLLPYTPYEIHQRYEHLHPFTDGNGRSGRMLWAWMKYQEGYRFWNKFLRQWYYDSLDEG